MLDIKKIVLCLAIFIGYTIILYAQSNSGNKVTIVKKQSQDSTSETEIEVIHDYGRNNSGVLVMQTPKGIVYKSHLKDFDKVEVRLLNRDGALLYEYSNEMKKNVDYVIALDQIPAGEYVLRLEYAERLVICNVVIAT